MRQFLSLSLARRELRGGLRGFYIFILCLVLGVSAIGSVQSLSRNLQDSLRYDGRYILGGDVAFRTQYQPAKQEEVEFLRRVMGPTTVVMETRAMARTLDSEEASLTELKAVDPFYPLYGELEILDAQGNKIDGPLQDLLVPPEWDENHPEKAVWGALVEKELLQRLNVSIGDKINVGYKDFEIRGVISKEPDRIGNLRFVLAPRVMISSYVLDETGLVREGSQVYYDHKVLMPYVKTLQDLKDAIIKIDNALPEADWRGRNFMDASPSARRMIDRLTTFLTLISLSVLLIGGVGISNATRSFLDEKLPSIATMKCMGAPATLVFKTYLWQIIALSLVGIVIGVAVAAGLSIVAGNFITSKLALTHIVALYPDALIYAALFGLLTVLSFTLWLIGRAVGVPPTDLFRDLVRPVTGKPSFKIILGTVIAAELLAALVLFTTPDKMFAVWFVGGTMATFGLFYMAAVLVRFIAKHSPKPAIPDIRLALANLHRPGNITASVILSLGLGLTVLIAVALIEHNFSNLLRHDMEQDKPAFFFMDIQKDQIDTFKNVTENYPSVHNVTLTPILRGQLVRVNGVDAREAMVTDEHSWVVSSDRRFTYMAEHPENSVILEGEWWPADYNGPPLVSIESDVAETFNIGTGAELTINILGRDITATVANVRDVNYAGFSLNFAMTFAPGVLDNAPATWIGTLGIDPDKEEDLQRDLARELPNVTSVRVRDALAAAAAIVGSVAQAVQISAALALVAGTLVLAGGIAAGHRRRVYDAVILKVMGATRKRILSGFMLEYGLLGILTALISVGLGTLTAWGVQTHLMDEMPWEVDIATLLAVTALCLGVTLVAGFIGTWRLLGQKPASMLRNQ